MKKAVPAWLTGFKRLSADMSYPGIRNTESQRNASVSATAAGTEALAKSVHREMHET